MTEVVGSGPFRFKADERVQGSRFAYANSPLPAAHRRQAGLDRGTEDRVHYDRVDWTTTPDAGTGVAALQTGEQDWQETTPHDLLPMHQGRRRYRDAHP